MIFLITNHWFACIWIGFRSDQGSSYIASFIPIDTTDLTPREVTNQCFVVYVNAWHFVVTTMSQIGYGDIKPQTENQRLFVIMLEFSALLTFALIKDRTFYVLHRKENNVNNLISNVQDSFNNYLERLSRAR